jgi:succinate dehydrogenase/fumarate reductase flavoprotein subunit
MVQSSSDISCDVLVVGSGAGGLSTAIVAKHLGLDVIVTEKAPVYGGTTAISGGVIWIPENGQAQAQGVKDLSGDALRYLQSYCGDFLDEDKASAYVAHSASVLEWFESHTSAQFTLNMGWADYRPTLPGGLTGRSLMPNPFDGRRLGNNFNALRAPLASMTIFGGMMIGRADLPHFLSMTRSARSLWHVTKLLAGYAVDRLSYRRGTRLSNGNALAASLAHTTFKLGIPIWLKAPAVELLRDGDRIVGAVVDRDGVRTRVLARRGVVLAAGGFPASMELQKIHHRHVRDGGNHQTLAPNENTGDGIRLGQSVGARFHTAVQHAAAWTPMSLVPQRDGSLSPFPHFIDRCKPGYIAVNRKGKRFVNEAISYHDFVPALIKASEGQSRLEAFLICDHRAISRYGLGSAPPNPGSRAFLLKKGYIVQAPTIRELAAKLGVDADGLASTVDEYNKHAHQGQDPEFGKGADIYQHLNGDLSIKPNPNIAPIQDGPYYAVTLLPGDIGTFAGLRSDEIGRALSAEGSPIPGLFVAGNDAASFMGGTYPAAGITIGPAMTFGYLTAHHLAGKPMSAPMNETKRKERIDEPAFT